MPIFLRPSAHNGLYGQNLLCQLDDGVPRLDGVAYVGLKLRKIIAVADEHGSDGIQARLLQHIQVHLDEQVALFDLLAVLSVDGEALPWRPTVSRPTWTRTSAPQSATMETA